MPRIETSYLHEMILQLVDKHKNNQLYGDAAGPLWLALYFDIGRLMIACKTKGYAQKKIQPFLSKNLRQAFCNGQKQKFSGYHLNRILSFTTTFLDTPPGSPTWPAIAAASWTHHIQLLCAITDPEERMYYIEKVQSHEWTVKHLREEIRKKLYQRTQNRCANFPITLNETDQKLAARIFKNVYSFSFLADCLNPAKESDLETGLINNIALLLKELGPGFCFIQHQYRVLWHNQTHTFDLLLYHTQLECHIIIDLKLHKFDARDIGQMSNYLEAADAKLKRPGMKDSIGILLCANKNGSLAQAAVNNFRRPILIATYHIG